jgi:PAS domain-containing protein
MITARRPIRTFLGSLLDLPERLGLTEEDPSSATTSNEILVGELRAANATLEAQTLRCETAIDNIAQGICFFDREQRLILSNSRYAEIYRLAPEQVRPGTTLLEIVERRVAAGTSFTTAAEYLALAASVNSSGFKNLDS